MPTSKTTRTVRKTRTARSTRTNSKRGGRKLSPAQKAQRKYAAAMRSVRKRAQSARRGKGAIRMRKAAKTLRRKLGIKG